MAASSTTGKGPGSCNKPTTKELAAIVNGPLTIMTGIVTSEGIPSSPPSTVATMQATAATWRLVTSARVYSGLENGWAQLWSVKPCQVMLNLPRWSLNENSTMTTIGAKSHR